jgi:hypothetical protein
LRESCNDSAVDRIRRGTKRRELNGTAHTPFTIADDEAVKVLLDKLLSGGSHQQRSEKLLKALDEASQRCSNSTEKVREAFFHGLLTNYAVALKLW